MIAMPAIVKVARCQLIDTRLSVFFCVKFSQICAIIFRLYLAIKEKRIMKYILENQAETIKFGQLLGTLATQGMVFCMQGDLGAGKTTMTKGIAKALEINKTITSPTFTILKIYNGRIPLYHFDAYRLEEIGRAHV